MELSLNAYYKKKPITKLQSTWMDLEVVILSEISQIKASITWYHLYVESKIYYK